MAPFTNDLLVTGIMSQFFAFWQMAENLMAIAYENGVNLFDTAEVYASGRSDFTFSPKIHQVFRLGGCCSFFFCHQ